MYNSKLLVHCCHGYNDWVHGSINFIFGPLMMLGVLFLFLGIIVKKLWLDCDWIVGVTRFP